MLRNVSAYFLFGLVAAGHASAVPAQEIIRPAPPAVALPADDMLTASAPTNSLEAQISSDPNFKPSYGTWESSIMFGTSQIANLKNILALYERKGFIVEQEVAEEQEEAPTPQFEDIQLGDITYPSFKLRSIAYLGNNNWSVWLNNRTITNLNNSDESNIVVTTVNKEFAEFTWIPDDAELLSAILQRQVAPEKAPEPDHVPINRLARGKPQAWLDPNTSLVHFALRPNQTFYSGTFEVTEGLPKTLQKSMDFSLDIKDENLNMEGDVANSLINQLQKDVRRGSADLRGQREANDIEGKMTGSKMSPKSQIMKVLGLNKK